MSACADAWMTQVCCSCALSPEGRVKKDYSYLCCYFWSRDVKLISLYEPHTPHFDLKFMLIQRKCLDWSLFWATGRMCHIPVLLFSGSPPVLVCTTLSIFCFFKAPHWRSLWLRESVRKRQNICQEAGLAGKCLKVCEAVKLGTGIGLLRMTWNRMLKTTCAAI